MKNFAVLYEGFDATHLAFFDHVRPQIDVLYTSVGGSEIGDHSASLSLEEASQEAQLDVLFIPGGDPVLDHVPEIVKAIKNLAQKAHHTIAIEGGSTLLARTGLLDKVTVAVRSEALSGLRVEFPEVDWENRELSRSAQFWSGIGSQEALKSLGLIFSAALKGQISVYYPGQPTLSLKRKVEEEEPFSRKRTSSPGQICANEIRNSITEADAIESACCFAGRLASEGFLEPANTIILSLCATLPNGAAKMNYIVRAGFEFLWDKAGSRPDVIWDAPSAEDLHKQEISMRGKYPESEEEKIETLELLGSMIGLGDLQPRPYSMWHATALALELGQQQRARKYMELLAQLVLQLDHPMVWVSLIKWRVLAGLILEGIIGHVTGKTPQGAQEEAEHVVEAITAFPALNAKHIAQRSERRKEVATLSFEQLLERLDSLKDESEETLRRPPASPADISATESRLGVTLPEDFKAFLRVSNGSGFSPSLEKPGIRAIESIDWEEPKERGLDDFRIDLGLKLDPSSLENLPRLGRILTISYGDDEDILWLVEPSQVEKAIEAIGSKKTQTPSSQDIGWRAVYWAHYLTELEWHGTFHEYIESVILGL